MLLFDEDSELVNVIYYDDRSAAETDDTCGMKYWWNRCEGGIGMVAKEDQDALKEGKELHEDTHAVALLTDAELASEEALGSLIASIIGDTQDLTQEKLEVLYRRAGWAAAFALYIEPRLRKEFENVAAEDEIILDRDPLMVAVTPDRLLRHREGRYLVYKEFKSTITAGNKWVTSWTFAPQLHIGLKAIEEEYKEKIAYGQIIGVMKGDRYGGRLSHPYVWAYYNEKTGAWTHDYEKARSHDWQHRPVWEYEGGVLAWVKRCGEEVAQSQFPHSAPVFLNERMLADWVTRRTARLIEIADLKEECQLDWNKRVMYFEPRTSKCRPAFGPPCPYIAACHNAQINENPLASTLFRKRQPHHEIELILMEEKSDAQN